MADCELTSCSVLFESMASVTDISELTTCSKMFYHLTARRSFRRSLISFILTRSAICSRSSSGTPPKDTELREDNDDSVDEMLLSRFTVVSTASIERYRFIAFFFYRLSFYRSYLSS